MSKRGRFLGFPYDWRRQSARQRILRAVWNPKNPKLFVAKGFGWGYTINFARLFGRRA